MRSGGEDALFKRYLLGELSQIERDKLEGEYFTNDLVHERLVAFEQKLIGAYVRGALSLQEEKKFERGHLTTDARRLEVARAASRKLSEMKVSRWARLTRWGPYGDRVRRVLFAVALFAFAVLVALWPLRHLSRFAE